MKKFTLLLPVLIVFFGCNSDDNSDDDPITSCATVECDFIGVALEFRDATTGEDLFFNETLTIDDLVITNATTGNTVEFSASESNQGDAITILLPEPEEQIAQSIVLTIFIENVFNFTMSYDVSFMDNPCCQNIRFNNLIISGIDFEEGTTTIISDGFVILVEL